MQLAPTIRGVFVKSHLAALQKEHGSAALEKLRAKFHRSLEFGDSEEVPVRVEVELLEDIVDITSEKKLTKTEREIAAGMLHFKNFSTTPLWRVITSVFGQNLKLMLMQSSTIAGKVFHGVIFSSEDLADRCVKVIMENNDYPIEHFLGFFEEWIAETGLNGYVEGYSRGERIYEYIISWNEPHITVVPVS